ncbi:MAG: DUF2255 family protein [Gemmatimonadaceae bacterium]
MPCGIVPNGAEMPAIATGPRRGFSAALVAQVHAAKILGVRAGREHRFLGVWVVVVKGRVFVRPWNDKPNGWYRAFVEERRGAIQLGEREIAVRARHASGERLMDSVDEAYAAKYPTPGSRKWVRGFATARRRGKTLELLPV